MQLTPFEPSNLIFIDTEFSSLDPHTGQILSLGIVKLSGEELYLELEYNGEVDPWVARHIVPTLTGAKVSGEEAKKLIKRFIGKKMPFAVAYVDNYDNLYFVKLFGAGKLPFKWMSIDFASILFGAGIDPTGFLASDSSAKTFYKKMGIDFAKYKQHHALDDARLLRDVWVSIVKNNAS